MISVSHYQLWPQQPLNARTSTAQARCGALIRHQGGYGSLHPWPELGDLPLEAHLESLHNGAPTLMAQQALLCCERDGAARAEGVSLFAGKTIPQSHATLTTLPDEAAQAELVHRGFTHAKLKVDGRNAALKNEIERLVHASPLLWRLDFNATIPPESVVGWFQALSGLADRIDFLEDPTPFDAALWEKLSARFPLCLAVDWHPDPVSSAAAAVRVWKPAAQPLRATPGQRIVATSLMDHPLGQAHAAWMAAECLPANTICGLQTHHVYEVNEFSALLGENKPAFQIPPGPGLGFGRLLEKLPWQPLRG